MEENHKYGERCSTGILGLDDILDGGFPKNRLHLVQGDPGVGKTTLAMQFLLEGLANGERGLYITLSETADELKSVAVSHGWSLDGLTLFELSAIESKLGPQSQTTLLHPSEVELSQTSELILKQIEEADPQRVVFDSLSELRLLAQNSLRYRRQLLAFKQFLNKRNCTTLLLDDRTADGAEQQVQSLAHGVLMLEQVRPEYGCERRRLSVVKMRGSKFRGGHHDFAITTGGLDVFPRLVASEHHEEFPRDVVSSGVGPLDALLGGGMTRGTSNLLIGPAGSGKSTIAMQYAVASAQRGEATRYFLFDENLGTMMSRGESLGVEVRDAVASKNLVIRQIDPAELSPGEFAHIVRRTVERDNTRVVILDSLNGYLKSMPEEKSLVTQLHELLTYLSQKGVVTIMVLAQHGMVGRMESTVDVTYLADTVVLLRYFEAFGEVRKAVAVVKKRNGGHEATIRELRVGHGGICLGEPLVEFQGVLTGTPQFLGTPERIMRPGGVATHA